MDWSGVDYCDVFIRLSFWRHPFTAEHPLLRHWCRDTFLQTWWRNKLILISDGLEGIFSTFLVNSSLNVCSHVVNPGESSQFKRSPCDLEFVHVDHVDSAPSQTESAWFESDFCVSCASDNRQRSFFIHEILSKLLMWHSFRQDDTVWPPCDPRWMLFI